MAFNKPVKGERDWAAKLNGTLDDLKERADGAQTTANSATSIAEGAQSTATAAQSAASAAQTTANSASATANAAETPAGAQAKANSALASANSYTDSEIAAEVTRADGKYETPAGAQAKVDTLSTSVNAALAGKLDSTVASNTYAPLLVAGKGVVRQGDLALNPLDYGAVGDGVADDTAALQACIDAAAAQGRDVVSPRAMYLISATVTLPSNARVDLGGSTVRRKPGTAVTYDLLANADLVAGNTGIRLTNVVLDGNKDADTLVADTVAHRFCGLRLSLVTDSHVESVIVTGTVNGEEQGNDPALRPAAGIFLDRCTDVDLVNVNGYGNDRTAIHLNRSTRCRLNGSRTWDNTGSGVTSAQSPECEYRGIISHDNGYSNLSVNGPRSRISVVLSWGSAFSGVNIGHTGAPADDTVVSNVHAYDNGYEGITIAESKRVLVSNFEVHGNARNNIRAMAGTEACRFVNGIARNSAGGQGIYLESGAGHSVSQCEVFGNAVAGIYVAPSAPGAQIGPAVRAFNNGAVTSTNSGGVLLVTTTNCRLVGVEAFDDQVTKTQESGVWIAGGSGHVLMGTRIEGNKTNQVRTTSAPQYVMYEGSGATGAARVTGSSLVLATTSLGFYGVAPVARAAAISSPAADVASLKTAVDALIAAVKNVGLTA